MGQALERREHRWNAVWRGADMSLGTAEGPKGPGQVPAKKLEVSWAGVRSPAQA